MARIDHRSWRVICASAGFAFAVIAIAALWLWLRPCGWDALLGRPGFDDPIASLAFFDGKGEALWVGGFFMEAHGVPAIGAATWDGARWSAAGPFNGPVRAMKAVHLYEAQGPLLVAGGQFTQVRGIPQGYIATFNGERWASLANGFNHWALALTVFEDGAGPALYAAGQFTMCADEREMLRHIARWDGEQWVEVGGGVNGAIHALHVHSIDGADALIAAGEFTRAGDIDANWIAAWNGREWLDLGGGFDHHVLALGSIDSGPNRGLYAGGRFTRASGGSANRIARWDEVDQRWVALGDGVDRDVEVMAQLGGSLIVAGRFTRAGDVDASRIARWDGEERGWSAIGRGLDGPVHALLVDPRDRALLYVAGNFTRAGRREANHLAVWRECR